MTETALHVATFNLRNTDDRIDARFPLVLSEMEALQPDILGLQECIFPMHQDRLIGAAGLNRYEVRRGWTLEAEIGNSLLVREPHSVSATERLDLGQGRSALAATVSLDTGAQLLVAVVQLHHSVGDAAVREEQVERLATWLLGQAARDAIVVLGDFNARPDEPAHARMAGAGFRSAHAEAHGREPDITWPTGSATSRSGGRARRQGYWLQQPEPGTEEPGCFDYIWVRGDAAVDDCELAFAHPAADDPTLYPSDRYGLSAHLRLDARKFLGSDSRHHLTRRGSARATSNARTSRCGSTCGGSRG